ncbi:MAG: hypothetical protein JWN45_2216 [Acidobacteriaceae bacterium]|nr:hypothetical protein [Acidobacteriaceae bacterium]
MQPSLSRQNTDITEMQLEATLLTRGMLPLLSIARFNP